MKNFLDKIKEEPGRIFGLVYPYVLIIGVGMGLFYIGSLNHITLLMGTLQSAPVIYSKAIKKSAPTAMLRMNRKEIR